MDEYWNGNGQPDHESLLIRTAQVAQSRRHIRIGNRLRLFQIGQCFAALMFHVPAFQVRGFLQQCFHFMLGGWRFQLIEMRISQMKIIIMPRPQAGKHMFGVLEFPLGTGKVSGGASSARNAPGATPVNKAAIPSRGNNVVRIVISQSIDKSVC